MQPAQAIENLVPHSGRMCLLSRLVETGEDWISAEVDILPSSTFVRSEGVPAWIGIEYMAQAVAAFSGSLQQQLNQPPKIGVLLGTRRYQCNCAFFEIGQTLTVWAQRELQAANGLHLFSCTLEGEQVKAAAKLNIFEPEQGALFLQGK